ncbi:nicotinamide mononucleotide transporter [Candidatus Pacearchaeota archaeon]|nr:nicotinamide mononucleotide transporter [Candidatus Pacearchaeota archaeon]
MTTKIKNYFKDWTLYEKSWLIIFTIINLYLFYVWHDTLIGLTASLTGMVCVILTAKGKISSFYFGLINILTYSYVAYQSAYYGDVMLNMLYFLPMTFFGIYFWSKNMNKKQNKNVKVKSQTWKQRITWFSIAIVALLVYGLILKIINGTLPFIDSATTIFSIIAAIMLNKRLTEQWIYWIIVDILSVIMWLYIFMRGETDISMLVMWSAYLVNAVYGYYNWKKLEKRQRGN